MEVSDKMIREDLLENVQLQKRCLIYLDIDGVFAECEHRLPYYEKKEWDEFFGARMASDTICEDFRTTAAMLAGLLKMYDEVHFRFLTGRPERTKGLTAMWLRDKFPAFRKMEQLDEDDETYVRSYGMPEYNSLEEIILCRKDDDYRVGFKVKWELMYRDMQRINPDVLSTLDVYMIDSDYRNVRYCYQKALDVPHLPLINGITLGGKRLPSVHAVSSTSELGKG